jgi:F0F1-type ATP synthase delta subunit
MAQLKLPISLTGRSDIMRLQRELNSLNDFFAGAAARTAGTPQAPPKTTRVLDQLAQSNGINLLEASHRKALVEGLDELIKKAPSLHISFATEPTPKSVEPIVLWLRENIHPNCLVQTGVAPAIAAGCILRTPNKLFDMSMRVHLQKQSHFLNEMIAGAIRGR